MTTQFVALVLVSAGLMLLLWTLFLRGRDIGLGRRGETAEAEVGEEPLMQFEGNDLVEQFALSYMQVDALLSEGANRVGCSTRKIGGLFCEPVEVDSWSLALELFRRDKIEFKTYTAFLFCRRIWIRLLAGHFDAVTESHVQRVEKLVAHLNQKLSVPTKAVNKRVAERLEAAGVTI